MISKSITNQLAGSSMIRKMFEEGNRLKKIYGDDNVFDFSLGNPDLEPPIEVIEALRDIADNPAPGLHRYMNNAGYDSTRQIVSDMLEKESGKTVGKDSVVMTVGAAGALNVTLKTLLDRDDEVIVLAPYFVEYISYIKNHCGVPVVVQCDETTLEPDVGKIRKAITSKTKAIILNSPNNPSGAVYSVRILQSLRDMLETQDHVIYVISDEPYKKIVFGDTQVPPVLAIFKNVIICYSWSKALALPGDRIGFLAANPECEDHSNFMAGAIMSNRSLGFVNAPGIMQKVIERAIDAKVDVASYERRCNLLYDIVVKSGFQCAKPQGALYLFPKSPIPDDIAFAAAAAEYNLLVVPGSGFGMKGYFRLTFCVDEKVILGSETAFMKTAKKFGLKSHS
ncbi:MAG: pyridoxal phosphate-dependent aminotransferase [Saccharofermentanales bacterium]